MRKPNNLPDILPFVALLILTWSCLGAWLWFVVDVESMIYYTLLYVSFLGVVELGSGFGLELPDRRWLNLMIGGGFVGWMLSLLAYFS